MNTIFISLRASLVAASCIVALSAGAADAPKTDAATREQVEQRLREAQDRLDQAAHEVAELSMSLNDRVGPEVRRFVRAGTQRAMLGINIEKEGGPGKSSDGVRVVSVSPGGPADVAGIKANDVIVAFKGKSLHGTKDESPQQQLLAMLRDAKAGESVSVEYRRDGKVQKTDIVPKNLPDVILGSIGPMTQRLEDDLGPRLFSFQRRGLNGFGSAELVELSPTLGKYFGVEKGLLVVRAPRDEDFKLQDGDVILDIDGRVPNSVSHAVQILSSYGAGEKLKLHIVRQQKRVELQVDVPDEATRGGAKAKGAQLMIAPGEPDLEPQPPFLPAPPALPAVPTTT